MRTTKSLILCAALLALTAGTASAQDKRVHFNLGGGPTFGGGDLGDIFSTGWGPAVGIAFDMSDRIAIQFEYAYRRFANEDYVDALAGRFSLYHRTHQLDFNMIFNMTRPGGAVRVYGIAGPGFYERNVEIAEYVGTGIVCDPFIYVCGTFPVEAVLGSRGGWDFGFNFGAGVGFHIGEGAEFTIESRYHFVVGPKVDPTAVPIGASLAGKSADGHYYPLTFGFRF